MQLSQRTPDLLFQTYDHAWASPVILHTLSVGLPAGRSAFCSDRFWHSYGIALCHCCDSTWWSNAETKDENGRTTSTVRKNNSTSHGLFERCFWKVLSTLRKIQWSKEWSFKTETSRTTSGLFRSVLVSARTVLFISLGSVGYCSNALERIGRQSNQCKAVCLSFFHPCVFVEISQLSWNERETNAIETGVRIVRAFLRDQSKDSIEISSERAAEEIE